MPNPVNPIPDGFRTVTPHLVLKDANKAIEWYKRAFGAEVLMHMPGPGGQGCAHAELKIGDSIVMMAGEWPGSGMSSPTEARTTTVGLHLYVKDADAAFQKAVQAGASVAMPLMNMFWGDRFGKVVDPFGHSWAIATHVEDVSPEECGRRAEAFYQQMAGGHGHGGGCCDGH